MRTSLNKIKVIEDYLFKNIQGEDAALFEARLVLSSELREELSRQKKAYQIIRQYGRRQLKKEIELVHNKLFSSPERVGFSEKILKLFFR